MTWALMPLQKYAVFSGRSRRKEYWMFVLFTFLVGLILWIIWMVKDSDQIGNRYGPNPKIADVYPLSGTAPA